MTKFICFVLLILLFSCHNRKSNGSFNAFTLLKAGDSGIDFENKVEDREDFNILTYRNYYNGGGVAIGDINNDKLPDVYFTANMADNKLYLNKGNMNFEEISLKAGVRGKKTWCTGVTMADVNADGLSDIYVCYSGDPKNGNTENELFINNGNLTFTEKAKEYGLNDSGLSTHASFFDYDLDGDLDCYVLNNSYKNPEKISYIPREEFQQAALGGDRLYKNENGKFVNITQSAGILSNDVGFGLGISVGDVNGDLYPDIYISNDFWERDYLYINQKNGKFVENLPAAINYTSLTSMGSDIGDINNDGALDVFSTDMLPPDNLRLKASTKFDDYYLYDFKVRQNYHYQYTQNCLQVNNGIGSFTETANFSGIAATDWSWGALMFDMNLDGKKDLFVSNGVYHDITDSDFVDFLADKDQVKKLVEEKGKYDFRDFVKILPNNKRKNYAYINGGNLKFTNEAEALNLDQEGYSNGSAYGDLDNDGDLDLVVNNVNMEAFVYKNNASENAENHFVKFGFEGNAQNKAGIGATVYLYSKGEIQIAQNMSSRGFESSVDPNIVFGIGKNIKVDSARVIWADLSTQLLANIVIDKSIILKYVDAKSKYQIPQIIDNVVFKNISNAQLNGLSHIENNYIDYDNDRLMPHVLSTEGPKIIRGDVNNDKKEDFILLGAKDSPDRLFINTGNSFKESAQVSFESNKMFESISGALFDADKDGDLDYLVGLGGNEYKGKEEAFTAIYYENSGLGKFKRNDLFCPKIIGQISCIKPFDFDYDGDLDIFAGGKVVPGAYGLIPRSYMMRNDGKGVWTDVTNEFTGPIGMVTDAIWADINDDNAADLIVVGEWMPVTVFINDRGTFAQGKQLPMSEGWWNTIEANDIDSDGDVDFMLGNWGTNIKFKASETKPLNLYVADFDDNKRPEVIMEWFTQDDEKPFPFASKQDLFFQMPALKKKSLKYREFAAMQVNDLFDKDKLAASTKRKVTNFSSSVLINEKGSLILRPLQSEAQMSPIFAFQISDFDNDGKKDYIAAGNFYRLKPEIGRHEGFHGGYFKGDGKGNFKFINTQYSGLNISGEVRDIEMIDNKILIGRNNESVLAYKLKTP